MMKTFLHTGLRVSELVSMSTHDINFDEKSLYCKGKGDKIRVIDLSLDITQHLKMFIGHFKLKSKDRLFPFTRQNINAICHNYDENLHPHKLRHTYAIQLLRKTKNLRFLQKQLGHARLNTTALYLQFIEYDEEKKQLAELF